MKTTIRKPLAALALLASAFLAQPASALATVGTPAPVPYVAAFVPTFNSMTVPYTGTMQLTIADGTIAGTYEGISARPDPFENRTAVVTGAVNGKNVMFNVGNTLAFTGSIDANGTIKGTATMNGRLYNFEADRGAPGSGKQPA